MAQLPWLLPLICRRRIHSKQLIEKDVIVTSRQHYTNSTMGWFSLYPCCLNRATKYVTDQEEILRKTSEEVMYIVVAKNSSLR